jgi:hypothetical protein
METAAAAVATAPVGDLGTPGAVAAPITAANPTTATAAPTASQPLGGDIPSGGQKPIESWYSKFADENARGYAELKGFRSPEDAVTAARHLESIVGAEKAGKTLVMPGADATEADLKAYYTKLGVPQSPADYKLLAEGQEATPFTAKMQEALFEAKIPAEAAKVLTAKYGEYVSAMEQQRIDAKTAQINKEDTEFRAEKDYAEHYEIARRAIKATQGYEEFKALKEQVGFKFAKDFFLKLGRGMGEHAFVQGTPSAFGMSVEAAKVQLKTFQTDPSKRNAFLAGDSKLRAERDTLLNIIAGGNVA